MIESAQSTGPVLMYIERRLVTYIALLIATIYYVFGKAEAATLQLEPVSVRLTPTSRSAVMQLRNGGAEPMQAQVRAFRWHQAGGEQFVRIPLAEDLSE